MANGADAAGPEREGRDAASQAEPAGPRGGVAAHPMARLVYRALGYAALALALAGVVLPLLPTVPFLLIAAWAFARSDPHVLERLHRHRRLGPLLRDWQAERAIPTRAKVVALAMMAGSWTLVAATATGPLVPALLGAVLAAVALYLVTRPAPGAGPPR